MHSLTREIFRVVIVGKPLDNNEMSNDYQSLLTNVDSSGSLQAQYGRRLSDLIAKAFYQACGQKNALAANYLLRAFEAVHSFEADLGIENRRVVVDLISEMRRELLAATSPLNSQ